MLSIGVASPSCDEVEKFISRIRARIAKSCKVITVEKVRNSNWIIFEEPIILKVWHSTPPLSRVYYINYFHLLKSALARHGIDISLYFSSSYSSAKTLVALPPQVHEQVLDNHLLILTTSFHIDKRGLRSVKIRIPRPVYDYLTQLAKMGKTEPHILIVGIEPPPAKITT